MVTHDITTRAQALLLRVSGASCEEICRQTGIEAKLVDRIVDRAVERGFDPQSQHPMIRDRYFKDSRGRRSQGNIVSKAQWPNKPLGTLPGEDLSCRRAVSSDESRPRADGQESNHADIPFVEVTSSSLVARLHKHAMSLLSPLYPSLDPLRGFRIFRTADSLLRRDASDFLLNYLPLWEGPWQNSQLPLPAPGTSSLTDRLVMLEHCINILEKALATGGLALYFHRVLQYQVYCQFEQEAVMTEMVMSQGRGVTSLTLDLFLARLYEKDWETISQPEKKKRRKEFHRRKAAGKRLQFLCNKLGYGILLLGSRSALSIM